MTEEIWTPFGLSPAEVDAYGVLVEGVPVWMREPLVSWAAAQLIDSHGYVINERWVTAQSRTRMEMGARIDSIVRGSQLRSLLREMAASDLLVLIDFLVGHVSPRSAPDLEGILCSTSSRWMVGHRIGNRFGLVERVPEGVRQAAESVAASTGTAGALLSRAWAGVHGFEPSDSGAYADAVRAVEIAAIAVVQPSNDHATLGTVIGQMRADGDWTLPLRERKENPSSAMLLNLAAGLWLGHRDRHGSPDYSDVTHEEARVAVVMAVTLVDWFSSGAVARRAKSDPDA